MLLRLTLAILKTALVLASVVLLDDIMHDKLPSHLAALMPAWVWLLPTRGFMET
jgi:hypothetical protein